MTVCAEHLRINHWLPNRSAYNVSKVTAIYGIKVEISSVQLIKKHHLWVPSRGGIRGLPWH